MAQHDYRVYTMCEESEFVGHKLYVAGYGENGEKLALDTDISRRFGSRTTGRRQRKRLFNLLMEFAATPLDKRHNTKYYVSVECTGYFGKNRTFWVSEYNTFDEDYELSSKYKDAAKLDEELADKIIGMLPPVAAIKKTKVAVE